MLTLVLLFIILVTVARARAEGMEWLEIAAFPSRWLYYVLIGGVWGPTFSACVGLHVRDGVRYLKFWNHWRAVIDTVFYPVEKNHCAQSLERCEDYLGRKFPADVRWGHQATTQRNHQREDDAANSRA